MDLDFWDCFERQDGSRFYGLFWKGKTSFYRTVMAKVIIWGNFFEVKFLSCHQMNMAHHITSFI